MKISKDFCEKEQNDVKQRVSGTSFYGEVTGDMFDPNLFKEADAEELRRF